MDKKRFVGLLACIRRAYCMALVVRNGSSARLSASVVISSSRMLHIFEPSALVPKAAVPPGQHPYSVPWHPPVVVALQFAPFSLAAGVSPSSHDVGPGAGAVQLSTPPTLSQLSVPCERPPNLAVPSNDRVPGMYRLPPRE